MPRTLTPLLLMLAPAAGQPVWHQRFPANAPSDRFGHGMVYDSVRGECVLFGGLQVPSSYLNDTWSWDGTDWRQRQPASRPGPRVGTQMAWNPARGRAVLFGGYNAGTLPGDTWEWDGVDWTERSAGNPPPRAYAPMETDTRRRRLVIFGGYTAPVNDTWELETGPLARARTAGAGCAGCAGTPALAAAGLPRLGNASFALRIEAARPSAGALFAVGATGASTPFGPCTLHLAWPLAVFSAVTDPAGVATLPLPVPDLSALRGAVALAQAVVADPCGAWQQLLAFTNALELTLGD